MQDAFLKMTRYVPPLLAHAAHGHEGHQDCLSIRLLHKLVGHILHNGVRQVHPFPGNPPSHKPSAHPL